MLKIRKALEKDKNDILEILKELDLYYAALQFKDFWAAESKGEIVGTVQIEDLNNFAYLGSLAVPAKHQQKGIAAKLLKEILPKINKDIYLYTIVPEFFEKFGFKITRPIPGLPSKDRYECEYCHSEKCVCMVKYPGDS